MARKEAAAEAIERKRNPRPRGCDKSSSGQRFRDGRWQMFGTGALGVAFVLSLAVAMPPEIRNNMLGRFSAMGAANDRDGIYSPEVIKELAAFRILALKHPQTVFDVVHSDSLKNVLTNCSSPANKNTNASAPSSTGTFTAFQ